jgi:hypothetical protein
MQAAYREMTPAQKFRRMAELTAFGHRLALAQIRLDFPDEDDRTHELRLASRYIDAATMKKAFDWPPDAKP